MPARLATETLVEGTDEKVAYLLIPMLELQAGRYGTVGTTLLKNHPLADGCGALGEYGDYVLRDYKQIGRLDNSDTHWLRASFSKNYGTDPHLVRTFYETDERLWPPVLEHLSLIAGQGADYDCVRATPASEPAYGYVLPPDTPSIKPEWLRDRYDGPTKIKVEIYVSNTPPDATEAIVGTHYARSVHFDRNVVSCTLPPCLHANIFVPNLSVQIISNGSLKEYAYQVFPATQQTDWADHVFSQKVTLQAGVYLIEKRTAIVPTFS